MNYKSQYLYQMQDFNAVPPAGMAISKMYFRCYNSGSASFTGFKLGLAAVPASMTSLVAGAFTPTTTVFEGDLTATVSTGEWWAITLTQPWPLDVTQGFIWEACMSSASGSGWAVYNISTGTHRLYASSGNCAATSSNGADGTWPDIGFDLVAAPTNQPKIPPLANFVNMNDADTLWVNSPAVLVNTSSFSDTNYWSIIGYSATSKNGPWNAYSNPNDVLQQNGRGIWFDTIVNKTNLYYTFPQAGYYRIRLFTANRYGNSFVEKSVYVSNPIRKPKANFYNSKRVYAVYDRSQFFDMSSDGPAKWKWWLDPPCYTCGLYKNEFFSGGAKNDSTPNPYLLAADPGMYKVCLAVSNAVGADTLCIPAFVKVLPGYQMCNGADTIGTTSEGAVMPTIVNSANVQYVANGCAQGFRIAPCADTIILTLDRLRLRKNGGPLSPGDSLYIKTGILPGSPILRRYGGNDINNIKDSLRTVKFAGQQVYIVYQPVAPQGPTTIVNDSGFVIRWSSTSATYAKPTAGFTCPDTVYSGYKVVFQNTTTGKYPNYAWDLNNDYVYGRDNVKTAVDSIVANPTLIYNVDQVTQKVVCLRSYNCVGSDTVCRTFKVMPTLVAPFADFSANKTYGLTSDTFMLFDQSYNGANKWKWTFEPNNLTYLGGTDSTSQNPIVFLNTNTQYSVSLTASNSFGTHTNKKTGFITTISYPSPGSAFPPTSSIEDFGITRVRLNGSIGRIDTTTALKPLDGSAYLPLYNLSKTTLYRGGKYNVEVFRGSNPVDSMNLRVWIDFNRNANYLDQQVETIINSDRKLDVKYTKEFTVPSDASVGVTRMLVGASAGFSTISPYSATLGVYQEYGIIIGRDNIKPVVTLKGNEVVKTELNKAYDDEGASATDNIEGDISSRIVKIQDIDISHVGYYTVKYVVADNYGNLSDTVVRIVQVELNQSGPVISLIGPDTVYMEVRKDSYKEPTPGATAVDNKGTDISSSLQVFNDLDSANVGVYHVTYKVSDAFGFIAIKQRTIIVRDTESPTIHTRTANDASTVTHQIKTPFDENAYLRVDDNYWTNIVPVRVNGTVDVDNQGYYDLQYKATDGSGNVSAIYTLRVYVTNTIKPTIQLVGSSDVTVKVFTSYSDPRAVAKDYYNNPVQVDIDKDNLDVMKVGQYERVYVATDDFGNKNTVSRIIRVKDLDAPVITVLGDNPLVIVNGTMTLEEIKAIAGIGPTSIKVVDNYDLTPYVWSNIDQFPLTTPGTYPIRYTSHDVYGNNAQEKQRFLQIVPATGLTQLNKDANPLHVFPNPSKGLVNIELKQGDVKNIRIYNIAGKLIRELQPEKANGTYTIDLSTESEGMYMVRVETAEKTWTSKINLTR